MKTCLVWPVVPITVADLGLVANGGFIEGEAEAGGVRGFYEYARK